MNNKIHIVSNAHLDPIWLWRWQEGCGEVLQTFRSAVDHIKEYKGLVLDLNSRKMSADGKEIMLQGKQFDMLEYLITSKNTIITKEQIFDKIWGFNSETTTNVIEVYASGLRKELKKIGYDKYLKTIRGVGYIWSE